MNQSFCKHLRTKKMYIEATIEEALAETESSHGGPTHFWCNRTQTPVGPDELPVQKKACVPGRSCCED